MSDLFNFKGAEFDPQRIFRFQLWRVWCDSLPMVMIIGLNPSRASELEDDPTIRRCRSFASEWGFGGFYMTNLFAYRATKPKDLRSYLARLSEEEIQVMHRINNEHLLKVAQKSARVVFAWGAHKTARLDGRNKSIEDLFPGGWCLGKTSDGFPRHPLFVPGGTPLVLFKKTQ
jgi:hypothetical protein